LFSALIIFATACAANSQYVYDLFNPPDYCKNQTESCKYQGQVHFACNRSEDFAPTCSSIHDVVPMTQARIDTFLDIHNSLRSQVALGQLSGGLNGATFPPASRMSTLKWSEELSDLALMNAKQCKMQHDSCHNTAEFRFSGQNLGSSSTSINFKDPDVVILGLTNAWFNEYKAANASNIASCCFSYTKWEEIFKGKQRVFLKISFLALTLDIFLLLSSIDQLTLVVQWQSSSKMEAGKPTWLPVTTLVPVLQAISFIELVQQLQLAPLAQTQNIPDYVQRMNQLIPTDFEFTLNVNRTFQTDIQIERK
jgi:Cysteine-rich secretory protein family